MKTKFYFLIDPVILKVFITTFAMKLVRILSQSLVVTMFKMNLRREDDRVIFVLPWKGRYSILYLDVWKYFSSVALDED